MRHTRHYIYTYSICASLVLWCVHPRNIAVNIRQTAQPAINAVDHIKRGERTYIVSTTRVIRALL